MVDISTSYMGLKLKSPVIAGSSGMTNSVEHIKELAEKGVGAVVLKSLFEEQILHQADRTYKEDEVNNAYTEAQDYIMNYTRDLDVDRYLKLIKDAKAAVDIPVIASINCVTSSEWIDFAKKIEDVGADGLELNVFILPSDPRSDGTENEKIYFDIIEKIQKVVKIPLAIKISYYFSGLAKMALKLSWTGISGMVLFNRFFSPDIDIYNFEVKPTHVFSTPDEIFTSLRWVAMLSDRLHCDIAASTGVHDGDGVIKQLLAGAKAVQISSTLYKKGFHEVEMMNERLKEWMTEQKFEKLDDFVGKVNIKKADNPAAFERVQFMKYFSGIE
ncbi:MAG: dihydroorotate dehydrogenase-like protein [Bacteroidales bacterium]|nr:dihydroorotate dehydrogenase-like protein [Bacteroidales bacterium]MCF8388424.1 dihydroorotate dehydrogenase-like protein [Bacteroidales bacterium]MCF8396833.1 dihydroorotate dehydrogenase-like protein [Bacteroidales bacterium]